MYEQYTDKQIVEMLIPKLKATELDWIWEILIKYPETNKNILKAIALIYRSAYIRGRLGRSFIIGEKKTEEKKTKEPINPFKVGDKVKFLGLNIEDEEALNNRRFYPPVDTVGEVVELGSDYCFVQWPKDITSADGTWGCRNIYLEKVTEHWVPATKDNVKVGSKVRMIDEETYLTDPVCSPVAGTMGVVEKIDSRICLVKWPKGTTSDDDRWYCTYEELEVLLCE